MVQQPAAPPPPRDKPGPPPSGTVDQTPPPLRPAAQPSSVEATPRCSPRCPRRELFSGVHPSSLPNTPTAGWFRRRRPPRPGHVHRAASRGVSCRGRQRPRRTVAGVAAPEPRRRWWHEPSEVRSRTQTRSSKRVTISGGLPGPGARYSRTVTAAARGPREWSSTANSTRVGWCPGGCPAPGFPCPGSGVRGQSDPGTSTGQAGCRRRPNRLRPTGVAEPATADGRRDPTGNLAGHLVRDLSGSGRRARVPGRAPVRHPTGPGSDAVDGHDPRHRPEEGLRAGQCGCRKPAHVPDGDPALNGTGGGGKRDQRPGAAVDGVDRRPGPDR